MLPEDFTKLSNLSESESDFETHLNALSVQFKSLSSSKAEYQDKVKVLEDEVQLYKRSWTSEVNKNEKLDAQMKLLEAENEVLKVETRTKETRIVALLDGDGMIFTPDRIRRGKQGGHESAQDISRNVFHYMSSNYNRQDYDLSVWVFLNTRGILVAYQRAGHTITNSELEQFIIGFNCADSRFNMIAVGDDKEAADHKIKGNLHDAIANSSTFKILFGGCHDKGYLLEIKSLLTKGYEKKLILFPGYERMESCFTALHLPCLETTGIFLPSKLEPYSDIPPDSPPGLSRRRNTDSSNQSTKVGSFTEDPTHDASSPNRLGHPTNLSYSSTTQHAAVKNSTVEPSARASQIVVNGDANAKARRQGNRCPDPSKSLSKQEPPPCNLFYLTDSCKHGSSCRYGHNYILNEEHYDEMKSNAKRAPCPAINQDESCGYGDTCIYGHKCPALPGTCRFYMIGTCKFKGARMHKVDS